jgi:hypothetical protein
MAETTIIVHGYGIRCYQIWQITGGQSTARPNEIMLEFPLPNDLIGVPVAVEVSFRTPSSFGIVVASSSYEIEYCDADVILRLLYSGGGHYTYEIVRPPNFSAITNQVSTSP